MVLYNENRKLWVKKYIFNLISNHRTDYWMDMRIAQQNIDTKSELFKLIKKKRRWFK